LAYVDEVRELADAFHHGERVFFAAFFEPAFESFVVVEMIFDGALGGGGDEDDVGDAARDRFLYEELNHGRVDNGQHFLGHCLCGGQETCSKSGNGDDDFTDGLRHMVRKVYHFWYTVEV